MASTRVFRTERLAVCQRVICWRSPLTKRLMLPVCVEGQLSNHPSSFSPLCAYFIRFLSLFLFVPLFLVFFVKEKIKQL